MRHLSLLIVFVLLAGCATFAGRQLDQRFGTANPARFDQTQALTSPQLAKVDYWRDVKPITDNRCAVCHGCFDAPCQLQMGSHEGIARGGSKAVVYDAVRLFPAAPSRLFIDADSNAQWRQKGFHPVLNEREDKPVANLEASVMARLLKLKGQHSVLPGQPLPADRYDFSLDRQQHCPAIEEFDGFASEHPEWGMPYGLPALSKKDEKTLLDWLADGAPASPPKPPSAAALSRIGQWEELLNGSTFKNQLAARYIYEHWFLAHLYFDDLPEREFFELVRSKTPPGQVVQAIGSRRPFEDPGVPRVFYRFRPVQGTLLAKTHMPYALNPARLGRIKGWFLDEPYRVTKLPSYATQVAGNPFVAFEQLPVRSRYRFMLDEAQFTIMGFIKGPVCRGQVALNVITDYFWIGFINPDSAVQENQDFLAKALKEVRLPTEESSAKLLKWRTYSEQQTQYLRAKSEALNKAMVGRNLPNPSMLWNGDGNNPNAALTVFRHFDNATVVQGFVGDQPQTAMLMGYPLLERMHYLLVAGFDVFGNTAHQLEARLYMDFLRMEGELNVLAFLPKDSRNNVRDLWYRDAPDDVKAYMNGSKAFFYQDSGIDYKTDDPWAEFTSLWKAHMRPVLNHRYDLANSALPKNDLAYLEQLAGLKGRVLNYLPEAAVLSVRDAKGTEHHFTLIRNSAHSNISELFKEDARRLPEEDTMSVVPGFLTAYPNAFYRIDALTLPKFVQSIANMKSALDYTEFSSRYAIRRTDERFWPHSDALIEGYRKTFPLEAGLFDYNRFENR